MNAITHSDKLLLPTRAADNAVAASHPEPAPAKAARRTFSGASHLKQWSKRLRHVPLLLWLAWGVVVLALLWTWVPGWFTSQNPLIGQAGQQLRAPGAGHWLGTDALGRDLWARIVYGAVHSLSSAFVAVSVGLVAGSALGLLAGAIGGRTDTVLMRVVDVLLAVPSLLLSLTIIILLGFGSVNTAIAVGVASVASFARLVRSEVLRVRRSEYVEAAFGSGGKFFPVLWRHVLPNSLTSVIALAALQFGSAILAIATLSFLGFGAPPPTPEWGLLIAEGRNYLATSWWLTTVPGLVVVSIVLAVNRISVSLSGGQS